MSGGPVTAEMTSSPLQRAGRVLTRVVIGVLGVLMLVPLLYLVVIASQDHDGLLDTLWFEDFALFANISEVLHRPRFVRYIVNSVIVSTIAGLGECLLAGSAGYALAKMQFPGRRLLFTVVVATLALSPVVTVIPIYALVQNAGFTSTYLGLIVPLLLSGFGVFLVRQFASGIPDNVLHAARIDGASEMRIFFTIAVPLLRPALLTLFLIVFVAQWDNLLWPLRVSNDPNLWTLPVALSSFQTEIGVSYRLVMAGSVITIVPPLILFATMQRYYVRGLSMGSLKG